jgi:uncharacterized membrane protein YraQ (UPF0718 family)
MFKDIISGIAYIYNESALYILFGFLLAGVLKTAFPPDKVLKHLGGKNIRSVLLASFLGIPLPLCSCAVLPTAMSLRKHGASKGATLSFLISTPETGVDSISLTYALIDPIMTVFRPLSALITAVTAGIYANYAERREGEDNEGIEKAAAEGGEECCECESDVSQKGHRGKLLSGLFRYAFVDLLNDIVFWLIIGIVIAGILSALLPVNFFESYTGSGILSMFIMLAVGIPIYMCAASSTPIAAVLIMKGLNPGAALVFLLAGPATNVGTIAAVGKFLGKKMMVIYLGTIAVVSVCLGILLNFIYSGLNINPAAAVGQASEIVPSSLKLAGSIILSIIIIKNLWDIGPRNALKSLNEKLFEFTGFKISIKFLNKTKP